METDMKLKRLVPVAGLAVVAAAGIIGCRNHMPHALTWPGGGDIIYSHAKPPEGGYYSNWDPFAVELEVTPLEDVNPVRTQHVLIATVKDKNGKPLPNRRVEWIISEGSVGDIVEVDESGWRNSRGWKQDNHYAVSHTNNFKHVLDRGNDDPSDDVSLTSGQTWCTITSPIEGTTYITAYAPGIYDWAKHKVFAVKHWYDVKITCPPPATNPIGTNHQLVTRVVKNSDGAPLANHVVTYKILDGPDAVFEPGGQKTATVNTGSDGTATITLKQTSAKEGTNNIEVCVMRPENVQCCKPAVNLGCCRTSKTWIGPKIGIDKKCTPSGLVGDTVNYTIVVNNPSQVAATNVVVTDNVPNGIQYVSSTPAAQASGNSLTWSLGSLAAGASATINVTCKATQIGTFENCAEVKADYGLSGRSCCKTVITAPKLALDKKCTAAITPCDPIEYVITVRNTGDGVAKNVKVTDQLPAGITTSDGQTSVVSNVGDLGPGATKEIRFTAKATKSGRYDNRATATADGGLTAEAACTTVVTTPVLKVTKTSPTGTRYIGRPADFNISVQNTGDAPVRDTRLVDTLPGGLEFISASDGGAASGGTVTWNLGTIEPGGTKSVKLTVKPNAAGNYENTASATGVCAQDAAKAPFQPIGIAAVLLECIDIADPIEVGQNETYEITVTNQGSANDTNIVITCEIPAEQTFVSGGGATATSAAAGAKTVTFAPLPSLAPKAKATWKVVVKANKMADVRFKISLKSDVTGAVPVEETESTHQYE
jgi:uncharacterized repeat protein (TIGR01451 family)